VQRRIAARRRRLERHATPRELKQSDRVCAHAGPVAQHRREALAVRVRPELDEQIVHSAAGRIIGRKPPVP
jgi:hypothetical protein